MNSPVDDVTLAENLDDATIATTLSWGDDSLFFASNNLHVNPTKIKNPEILKGQISTLLHIAPEKIAPKLTIRKKQYLRIISKMSIRTRDMVNKRIDTEMLALKNHQITKDDVIFPFLKIDDNLVRYYPEGNTTGQITGFVDGE